MYQMRLRKSALGISSSPSGMAELGVTRNAFTLDRSITTSFEPAMSSFTRLAVFSTIRPLWV